MRSGILPITVGTIQKPLIPVHREETEDGTSYYAPATSVVEGRYIACHQINIYQQPPPDANNDSDVTMHTASDDEGDEDEVQAHHDSMQRLRVSLSLVFQVRRQVN